MKITDYEMAGFLSLSPKITVCEVFKGSDVVMWAGSIERQIRDIASKYRDNKDNVSADKAEAFLQTWRQHKISGSLNRSDIEPLETAATQLAVDRWPSSSYFQALRDQLRRLLASEEELPRISAAPKGDLKPAISTPPAGRFAAQKEAPPGEKATAKNQSPVPAA